MTLSTITEQVRDMYTRFPYPPPNVVTGTPAPAMLDYTRFVLWPGRQDFRGMRVLDAGCGTGNTAVSIAAAYPEIEVVGIGLSETSLRHTRALARKHRVGRNLQLHCLPIQEVASLGHRFDYIVASGVIHHLDDPVQGLRALTDVLTPTGGVFLMLYATYGRAGVYQLQNALRLLSDNAEYDQPDGQRVLRLQELPVSEHYTRQFDLQTWQATILQKCDGTRSTLEIFLLGDVQAAIPGDDVDAKLDLYGELMEMFAAQEVILCEP